MRKILMLFLFAATFIMCNNPNSNKLTPTTDLDKIIRQYFDHFNNHEWTKMAAMYSDTAEFKDPSMGPGIVKQTKAQIIEKYDQLQHIFPDLHDDIIQTYTSGDNHIIVEFISTGTAEDGSKFELPICTIFTIEHGLITKDFTYYDNFEDPESEM